MKLPQIKITKKLVFCLWQDEVSDILERKKARGQTLWKIMNLARAVFIFGFSIYLLTMVYPPPYIIERIGIIAVYLSFWVYWLGGAELAAKIEDSWLVRGFFVIVSPVIPLYRLWKGNEIRKPSWKEKKHKGIIAKLNPYSTDD